MKRLKIFAVAAIVLLLATAAGIAPHAAKANASWQPEVLASSAQVRFEAQPTSYDATTNKYKYKFSWLMPRNRTYSFKIDGNLYNPRVTANGVAETPFWFSPDITYTIEVYPYANGRGPVLAKGSFKAPSVIIPVKTLPVESALTFEQEVELWEKHAEEAPILTTKTIKDNATLKEIKKLTSLEINHGTFSSTIPYFSKKSQELFAQMPLFVKFADELALDLQESGYIDLKAKNEKIKILDGKQFAIYSYESKSPITDKYEKSSMVLVKEGNEWKFDMIQSFKMDLLSL